jgi:hypothetical protein
VLEVPIEWTDKLGIEGHAKFDAQFARDVLVRAAAAADLLALLSNAHAAAPDRNLVLQKAARAAASASAVEEANTRNEG